jgi:SPP1 family predicted phage head-tail adaptor
MIPGSLNKRITIEELSITKDAGGTAKKDWTDFTTVWANKFVRSGNMKDGEHSSRVQEDVEWTIWYRDDINTNMRIKYNNQYYRIEFIDEIGNKDGLKIVTNMIRQGK